MKKLFTSLTRLLAQTWLWSLLVVIALALLIWFAGPLLAVADHRFWESATSRLLTICGLLLAWGLFLVASDQRNAAGSANNDQDPLPPSRRAVDKEQATLRRLFKSAVQTLQRSGLYSGHSARWRKELPWYLMIGPEGAGKTSLLDHSGVKFPLNHLDGQQNSPPPATQQCDWYFAEQGVLLDTSGRYLAAQEPADTEGWRTLLKLLRRRRRSRPINGVLVNIPITLLLDSNPEPLRHLAGQVRSRLLDIHQRLHSRLPVYLVLTKADNVQGFDAFFSQLSREESQQVLGISFKEDQQGTDPAVLHETFEDLLRRLNSQVVMRLQQERSIESRGRILDFPHRLGLIGSHLALLVETAFAGNRYEPASQLRGVYLASVPHWDSATPRSIADPDEVEAPVAAPRTLRTMRGAPRFVHHLLTRVVFPEAGLAGLDARESRRLHWGQRALYAGALGCLALFGLLWIGGFTQNHQRFEQLRTLGQQFGQQLAAITTQDDALGILPELETSYRATQVFPARSELALHERNGLYQGEPTTAVLQQRYQHELDKQLLPRVAHQLEGQIRANLSNRKVLLDNLRTYLMLGRPEHRDNNTLQDWVATDWDRRYAGNMAAQASLNEHFSRLLQQPFTYPLNDNLVTQARQALRKEPLAQLVYRSLREQSRNLPPYRLDEHLGPQGLALTGTHTVIPGLYTQQGYQQYFLVRGATLVNEFLRDNWVMGESSSLNPIQLRDLLAELEQLYFRDYGEHWDQALAKVALQPLDSLAQGADQAAALIASNSPLVQLLTQIRDNTRFPTVGEAVADVTASAGQIADVAGPVGGLTKAIAKKATTILADKRPETAKAALQRRFEPLHRLLDENGGTGPELAPAMAALTDLHQQLLAVSQGNQPDYAAFELAKSRLGGQRSALDSVRAAAVRLPAPITHWLRGMSDDNWQLVLGDAYHYLNKRYQGELYSVYTTALHERYPFHAHSASDVAIADFREFFKAQGTVDSFFDTYLKPFVTFDGNQYRLRSVEGRSLPVSRGILQQMSNVQQIRRGFFAENASEPLIKFSLEPYSLDANLSRADFRFGDKQLEYRHGPITSANFQWPNESSDGLTSLLVEDLSGHRTGIQKNTGQWSLFRLFDLMETEAHRGRDVLMLKADVGGLRANYLLLSQRSPNPFDLTAVRNFRLPAAL